MKRVLLFVLCLICAKVHASDTQAWLSCKTSVDINDISISAFVEARAYETFLSYHSELCVSYKFQHCLVGCSLREVFNNGWNRENRYALFAVPSYKLSSFAFKLRCMAEYSTFDVKPDRLRHRFKIVTSYKLDMWVFSLSNEVFLIDSRSGSNRVILGALVAISKASIEAFIGVDTNFINGRNFYIIGVSLVAR